MSIVDLHLHFDGSLDLETSYRLAKERNLFDCSYEEFIPLMRVKENNESLEDYLACFDLPIKILQDKEALIESMYALIRNLYNDGLKYAEIRFAPQFHLQKGLKQEDVVNYVLEGVNKACLDFDIKINLILCMMTIGDEKINHEENLETLRLCKKYLGKGVCALDIAGAEEISPLMDYKELFDLARELNVPYTIHAGESGSANNVNNAIELGCKRVGHGCHASFDEAVIKRLVDNKIPLEVCLTSNVHCKNQESYAKHAVRELYDKGCIITLNTDNMALSNTTLKKEYELALKYLFNEEELKQIMLNSINASFLTDEEKAELLK